MLHVGMAEFFADHLGLEKGLSTTRISFSEAIYRKLVQEYHLGRRSVLFGALDKAEVPSAADHAVRLFRDATLSGDAPEPLLSAAAVLLGHDAEPRGHLPAVSELRCVNDSGHGGRCGEQPDPAQLDATLGLRVVVAVVADLLPFFQITVVCSLPLFPLFCTPKAFVCRVTPTRKTK